MARAAPVQLRWRRGEQTRPESSRAPRAASSTLRTKNHPRSRRRPESDERSKCAPRCLQLHACPGPWSWFSEWRSPSSIPPLDGQVYSNGDLFSPRCPPSPPGLAPLRSASISTQISRCASLLELLPRPLTDVRSLSTVLHQVLPALIHRPSPYPDQRPVRKVGYIHLWFRANRFFWSFIMLPALTFCPSLIGLDPSNGQRFFRTSLSNLPPVWSRRTSSFIHRAKKEERRNRDQLR